MEKSDVKWYATAGLAAIIGAAIIWYNLSDEDNTQVSAEEILKEMEAEKLDKPVHDANGQINT